MANGPAKTYGKVKGKLVAVERQCTTYANHRDSAIIVSWNPDKFRTAWDCEVRKSNGRALGPELAREE